MASRFIQRAIIRNCTGNSLIFAILFVIFAGCGGGGGGGNGGGNAISLAWDAPATNVDGTQITDLAGYIVYIGTTSGTYGTSINAGNVTTYTFAGLTPGQTYYIVVTAYDTENNESHYSNEASGVPR